MITLRRTAGWELRLAAYIEEQRAKAFVWASHDCVTFAAGAVQALTEGDADAILPIAYGNRRQGVDALRRLGGLRGAVESVLGDALAPARARIGDVGLVAGGGRRFLAVCNGATWLGPGPRELVAVGLLEAECCWRVG